MVEMKRTKLMTFKSAKVPFRQVRSCRAPGCGTRSLSRY